MQGNLVHPQHQPQAAAPVLAIPVPVQPAPAAVENRDPAPLTRATVEGRPPGDGVRSALRHFPQMLALLIVTGLLGACALVFCAGPLLALTSSPQSVNEVTVLTAAPVEQVATLCTILMAI